MNFSVFNLAQAVLLVVWAVLLFGGFIFGALDALRTRRMPTWMRMGSSLALVLAAAGWYLLSRGTDIGAYALWLLLGMTLGFIGDLFMAELILPGRLKGNHVLGGMASFGLGHVAYITGIVLLTQSLGLAFRWDALAIWLLIGFVGWLVVVYIGQPTSALHIAALPYALLLAGTAGVATGLAVQAPGFWLLALGAALFLLSDLILAAQLFRDTHFYLIGDVVWLTYGPGQMLIVYSVSSALGLGLL